MTHTTTAMPIDVDLETVSDVGAPVPLVEEHRNEIFRYLLRRLDRSEVLDAFVDVVAVVRRHIRAVPEGDGLLWLYSIAGRVVAARCPRTTTSCVRCGATRSALRTGDGVDVLSIVDGLEEPDREVLRLCAWEGLAAAEIAVVSGLTERCVRRILDEVTELLRDDLELRREDVPDDSMWAAPEATS